MTHSECNTGAHAGHSSSREQRDQHADEGQQQGHRHPLHPLVSPHPPPSIVLPAQYACAMAHLPMSVSMLLAKDQVTLATVVLFISTLGLADRQLPDYVRHTASHLSHAMP